MHSHESAALKLSICITTFNRAAFIGETLASILPQITDECEVVIVDGGSTDDTAVVVAEHAARCPRLRYIRQQTNGGFDRDLERAVQLARGAYCWLTSDDDLLKPDAIATVLRALVRDPSMIVLNVEFWENGMQRLVQRRWLDFNGDRVYGPDEIDRVFADLGYRMLYLGGVVLKRSIWLTRDSQSYYDSTLIFVGVIFQARLPGDTLVIAEPLIRFRMSTVHTWSSRVAEIIWFIWPRLVWSLAVSDAAKRKVCNAEPWRSAKELFVWRGLGHYSMIEYRKWIRPRVGSRREAFSSALIAMLPGTLINAVLTLYFAATRRSFHGWRKAELMLQDLRDSPFNVRHWRPANLRH